MGRVPTQVAAYGAPSGRQIDRLAGSWRGDNNRLLDPADDSRVEAECDRIAKREEEKISPAMRAIESQDPDRHLIGFDFRLKGHDRIKEKVYDNIEELFRSAEEAVSVVSDTIRYTFQYRESGYTQGVWTDLERLKTRASGCTNSRITGPMTSTGHQHPWIEPDTGQRFEVQFHTRISFEAKQLTHTAYERLRTKQPDKFEQMVLEAFQRKVTGEVSVPPGAADIPDYPREAQMPDRVTYYAVVDDLSSREQPAGVFRRTYTDDGGRSDEAFTRDLTWEFSPALIPLSAVIYETSSSRSLRKKQTSS